MNSLDLFNGALLFAIVFFLILEEIMLIVIAVKLADCKGKDSFLWGVLTFFFGLLPVFILALSSDNNYYYPDRYTVNLQQTERLCSDSNRQRPVNSRYAPATVRSRKTSSGWI